jgi:hypothetical protein
LQNADRSSGTGFEGPVRTVEIGAQIGQLTLLRVAGSYCDRRSATAFRSCCLSERNRRFPLVGVRSSACVGVVARRVVVSVEVAHAVGGRTAGTARARRRVDDLREEADRIQAELAAAEQEWQEWAIARRRVDTVLAPDRGTTADTEVAGDPRDADASSAPREAAKPKSQVPV